MLLLAGAFFTFVTVLPTLTISWHFVIQHFVLKTEFFLYLWFWRTKNCETFHTVVMAKKNYQYFIRKIASSKKMIFFQFENTDFHSFWQKLRFALNSQGWQHWLFYKNLCYCSIFLSILLQTFSAILPIVFIVAMLYCIYYFLVFHCYSNYCLNVCTKTTTNATTYYYVKWKSLYIDLL